MTNINADTVAKHLISSWIARFGVPLRISTDQGRQFESSLFNKLCELLGTKHLRTTAYHPQANGMIERFHRTFKTALMCAGKDWASNLHIILLALRNTFKEDLKATPAQLVFGEPSRIPGEFITPNPNRGYTELISDLANTMSKVRPQEVNSHANQKPFVFKDLATTTHVFVRRDLVTPPLTPPYEGPYEVLQRRDKYFVILKNKKKERITIDRLKPYYCEANSQTTVPPDPTGQESLEPEKARRRSPRNVTFHPSTRG